MAYTPFNDPWEDSPDGVTPSTTPITAAALDHIEAGIEAAAATTLNNIPAATAAVDLNGQKITGLGTPTLATDAATKAYADAMSSGLNVKASVRAATTANITLSGAQTIDGVAVVAGDRVLVKNQSTGAQNGIYVAASGAWSRATDADVDAEVLAGMFTFVQEGTSAADQGWVLTTNNPITVGTTALVFTQFSGVGTGISAAIMDAKGDLLSATAADTPARLAVGANKTLLTANSAQATGLQWVAPHIDVPGFRSVTAPAYGALLNTFSDQSTAVLAAQSALVADGGGILWFPPCSFIALAGPLTMAPNVHWMGAGNLATTLAFNLADTGAGVYCLNPTADNAMYISNMRLYGPGGSITIGSAPCNASAVLLSSRAVLTDVWLSQWNKCATVRGDHTVMERVYMENAYVGVSFPTSSTRGDQTFRHCIISNMALAAAHVPSGADNSLDNQVWEKIHVVGCPFGWLKQGSSADIFINETNFTRVAFENVGNSAISDLSTGSGPSWLHSTMDGSGWQQSDVYKYAALTSGQSIRLPGLVAGGYIRNSYSPFSVYVLGGSLEIHQSQGNGAVTPFISTTASTPARWMDDRGGEYLVMAPTGTVAANDLVELTTTADQVQRASGLIGAKPVIGVAAVNASGQASVKVKAGSEAFIVNVADAVATSGVPLVQKTGTLYQVTPATTSGSTTNPVIGYSIGASGAGVVRARLNLPV